MKKASFEKVRRGASVAFKTMPGPNTVPISPIAPADTHAPSLQSPFMLFRSPAGGSGGDFVLPSGSSALSTFGMPDGSIHYSASPGMSGGSQPVFTQPTQPARFNHPRLRISSR